MAEVELAAQAMTVPAPAAGSPAFVRAVLQRGCGSVLEAGSALVSRLARLTQGLASGGHSPRRPGRGLCTPLDVAALLGLPTLGVVPRLAARDEPAAGPEASGGYALALRTTLEAIQAAGPAPSPKVLLVTSSLPGEGKTTLALGLAKAAAGTGRALLIDLDLRQPSVHRRLGQTVEAGIVEHVAEGRPLEQVIRRDAPTGLEFLPVAGQTDEPTELIESDGMRRLIDACREHYDCVIIDTAPAGLITDARLAARLVDKVVFAVQWRQTAASVVRDGLRALRDAGVEPAGVVLTQADPRQGAA